MVLWEVLCENPWEYMGIPSGNLLLEYGMLMEYKWDINGIYINL